MTSVLAGLGLGFSLIIAIGAQNIFVLRQGIRREHVGLVVAICALSDVVLIVVGISGIGAATAALPWLVEAVRWLGAAFLVCYGLLAARRAWRPSGEALQVVPEAGLEPIGDAPARSGPIGEAQTRPGPTGDAPARSGSVTATRAGVASATAGAVALNCLLLTWLNPHVYLDTVFLLGSVGASHGDQRWLFAAGAMLASVTWFTSLGYGARFLGRWLSTVRAWRILDAVIAVVMVALGVSLVL
ncbi:MAG: LysE/ArgO family amino acid transporter [Propionicimonas sp.]|nr:LysE/ArgO family amino acid transporter [Propionicimonas sp.]